MSSLVGTMGSGPPLVLRVYLGLARLAAPVFRLVNCLRIRSGKDDPDRRGEKFGQAGAPRPGGRVAWVHAASVGETNSVLPLINKLSALGWSVVLTTVTRTSAELARQRLPETAVHQFAPFDSPVFVRRFLDHWRPDLAVFVESEIWPATLETARQRGVQTVLVNGRMSDRSFRGWSRLAASSARLFGGFSLVLAQSRQDADRFRRLGCARADCPGNLKFDAPLDPPDPDQLAELQRAIGARPVWLAALTHPGEDEIAIAAHKRLRETMPELLLVLVPRHPNRAAAIQALANAKGLACGRRSLGDVITAQSQVYLGDTIGEMSLYYGLASVGFLAGSFADVGGHNPVEPGQMGLALVSGPNVRNARAIYKALWDAGAVLRIKAPDELAAAVAMLLRDHAARDRQIERIGTILEQGQGALDRTMVALGPFLAGGR